MTVTALPEKSVTYARPRAGSTATPNGLAPTGTVARTVLSEAETTVTLSAL